VLVGEYGNGNSNGVFHVELRIIKNPELAISFDNTLTSLNEQPLSNNQWQYQHCINLFILMEVCILVNTAKILEINAIYHPPANSNGTFPIKATIKFFSGGEMNNYNDIDYI